MGGTLCFYRVLSCLQGMRSGASVLSECKKVRSKLSCTCCGDASDIRDVVASLGDEVWFKGGDINVSGKP